MITVNQSMTFIYCKDHIDCSKALKTNTTVDKLLETVSLEERLENYIIDVRNVLRKSLPYLGGRTGNDLSAKMKHIG